MSERELWVVEIRYKRKGCKWKPFPFACDSLHKARRRASSYPSWSRRETRVVCYIPAPEEPSNDD